MTLDFDYASIRNRANADPEFRLAARYWDGIVVLEVGDNRFRLVVGDGVVSDFGPVDASGGYDVLISGSAEQWDELLARVPRPSYQDARFAGFKFNGDLIGALAPYYGAIRRFLNILRDEKSAPLPESSIPDADRHFDAAVGRYVYVKVAGVQYRVYFEESGTGIPLVLQHTAGADARQWRHLLEDPDVRAHFRMIAYDLPFHGKSLPPTSVPWWQQEYRLTRSLLMETVIAICHALELDRPVFMGCSVGGHLALDLAYYHPEEFRAVIGINAGVRTPVYSEDFWGSWYHPRVGNEWVSSQMFSGMSPLSPEAYRREIAWGYSQAGPAVFKGDTYYYAIDHDLTGLVSKIDTSKVGVYLLTGEYDALAREGGSTAIAREIAGATLTMMHGIGHFAPAENPSLFRQYLMPTLNDIVTQGGGKPA